MSANYLYQIVYCSQRKERAFRREIAISSNSAMVTNIEKLPPAYDMVMDHLRNPGESVGTFAGNLNYAREDMGCPFCGNSTTFTCPCGAISCISSDHNGHHCCPRCDVVHRAGPTDKFLVSKSGFVDGRAGATHRLGGGANQMLGDQDGASYWRQVWEQQKRRQVIDAEVVEAPERLRHLLPGLQSPADKLQDALRRGLPPAQRDEPEHLSGLPWTKFLCDGSQNSDDDARQPGPPPPRLLGDGRDTQPSDGDGSRLAKLADRLNRNKR